MKTLPACLLLGLLAAASAAASDLSFTVGYGTARLGGGQTSASFLATKEMQGDVRCLRLSLSWSLSDRIGLEGSYFAFSDLTTVHPVDYSHGIPFAIPNNRFRREAQAFALAPTVTLASVDPWTVKAGVGWVFSDLRTTAGGGQEGGHGLDSHGNSGYLGLVDVSYAFTPHLAAGASVRYLDFGQSMVSSRRLTSRQADLFVAWHF